MLKFKELLEGQAILEVTQQIWEKMVRHGSSLCLVGEPRVFHLMVDYSSKGCGYALFAGPPENENMIGLNSRGHQDEAVSSYLGQLKGIFWALDKPHILVQGRKLVLWTD